MKNNISEDNDYYYREDGFIVFTEKYHLERGYCCGNGCRHCPFEHMNVAKENRNSDPGANGHNGQSQ
jgi:hypothetical protein